MKLLPTQADLARSRVEISREGTAALVGRFVADDRAGQTVCEELQGGAQP